ncbi:hypothetical protein A0H81_09242 [Grifola frondosa]|uniref:HNH nuclease domain-containing protein n=1 Tax=Grifola frondosa TaxID=5627 RepID=A0A1C7M1F4_GRIFR|nr:hypothetical protein A0H81_09242 [Grifola frondosa]
MINYVNLVHPKAKFSIQQHGHNTVCAQASKRLNNTQAPHRPLRAVILAALELNLSTSSRQAPNMAEHLSDAENHFDSSQTSILTRSSQAFNTQVLPLMRDISVETADLMREARAALGIFKLPGNDRQIGVHEHWIDVYRLLDAMLEGAKISGGERYTASVIIAATINKNDGGIKQLVSVAQDWLFRLLWPIVIAFKSKEEPTSDFTTPTIRDSEVLANPVPKNRPSSFHDKIIERRHQCAMSHLWERGYKGEEVPQNAKYSFLEATHFLRRSIMSGEGTGVKYELPATLDMLSHYAALPKDLLDDFSAQLDAPENGMMLRPDLHQAYDHFWFCLLATEETNVYTIRWFGDIVDAGVGFSEVRFTDHSRHGIPLPNPKFIAIQAAIAHVLHLSGAGEVIDAVIDRFFRDGVVPAGRITDMMT